MTEHKGPWERGINVKIWLTQLSVCVVNAHEGMRPFIGLYSDLEFCWSTNMPRCMLRRSSNKLPCLCCHVLTLDAFTFWARKRQKNSGYLNVSTAWCIFQTRGRKLLPCSRTSGYFPQDLERGSRGKNGRAKMGNKSRTDIRQPSKGRFGCGERNQMMSRIKRTSVPRPK